MTASIWTKAKPGRVPLIEVVISNLGEAMEQVMRNKGAPGVDGVTVDMLPELFSTHGRTIRQKLRNGTYIPLAVRRVDIPKPNGGTRMLGIPTALDRVIQQAIAMALAPIFEPQFSDYSYGFRLGRSAQMAVAQSLEYINTGHDWVVETDLSKFFDRVNHDILMSRLAKVIDDKMLLKLIRRYLQAGIMEDGLVSPRESGVPQGGNLSPLMSNVMLTELDRELERRGLRFCRYADDCNIYVSSEVAARRALANVTEFVETKLKLKVNRDKSGVFRPGKTVFLGYTFRFIRGRKKGYFPVASDKSLKKLKKKLTGVFFRARGTSLIQTIKTLNPILRGWRNYFGLDIRKGIYEDLDGHIRAHLRKLIWIAWKKPKTRARQLIKWGVDPEVAWKSAYNGRGAWWNALHQHMAFTFPNKFFDRRRLYRLSLMAIIG